MTLQNPLVSIGIPAYNAKKYIEQTIKSILSQDYQNIELIIQDNCSTDGTWEFVKEIAQKDNRVHVQQNERNIGMVGNFNRVISRAGGAFIMAISSDDFIEPDFVSNCITLFLKSPEIDIVTTNYHFYREGQKWQKIIKLKEGLHRNFVAGVVIANSFSINFTMFRRASLNSLKVNGAAFLTSFYTFDLEMWFRVAFGNYGVYFLDKPLGNFRYHAESASKKQFIRMFKQIFLVLMMHKEGINREAPVAYRIKLTRFAMRHIGHLLSRQSSDTRLMKAIIGELFR